MVGILDRKLMRELLEARGTLASVILVSCVGIACFVSLYSAYRNLSDARNSYYAISRMADFSVELKKAPIPAIEAVGKIPGITEIRPRISFAVMVDLDGVEQPISGHVLSLPDRPQPVVNSIVIKRGSYFTPDQAEQVIIDDAFARQRGLGPGDTIHLILNNRRQKLFVVGTAISSEFVYLLSPGSITPDPANYGIFYLKQRYAQEIYDFQGAANQIVGLLAPAYRDHPEAILDRIEAELKPYGVFSTTPRSRFPSHRFLSDEIKQLERVAIVLPAIFLAVSALVLNVLLSRLAEQQRTIIGTLKALGYTNGEIRWHFLKYGLLVGAVSGVLGVVLGYFLAEALTMMYRLYFEFPRLDNRAYPSIFFVGVAISVLFGLLGTLRGVHAVVKLRPAQAMRPPAPAVAHRLWVERLTELWNRLGFAWQMVLRELFRQRLRTLASVFAAAMGAALLLLAFGFNDSIRDLVNFQFHKLMRADYEITLKDDHAYGAYFEAEQTLSAVDLAEPVFNCSCVISHGRYEKRIGISGLMGDARLTVPHDVHGEPVAVPSEGLLIPQMLAHMLHVRAGDRVMITPIRGRREAHSVPIVQIVDSYFGLSAYADYGYLNRILGERAAVSSVQFKLDRNAARVGAFYEQLKHAPAVQTITDVNHSRRQIQESFVNMMNYTIAVIIMFAAVIFWGSVLTTSRIELAEKRGQMATFLVMGFTPRQVDGLFLRKSIVTNLTGAVLGLPLGYWLMVASMRGYETELFRMPVLVKFSSYVLTVLFAVVFVLSAHFAVSRAVRRLDWISATKVKE